jgi:hypothetical protein
MKDPAQILVLEDYLIKLFDIDTYSVDIFGQIIDFEINYVNSKDDVNLIGIKVYNNTATKELSSCIIGAAGGNTAIQRSSTLISFNGLVFCCGNALIRLNIPNLHLEWKSIIDSSSCLEVEYLQKDYIIHGETQISRVDKNGKIIWQQSGQDIFVIPEGSNNFLVNEKEVVVVDWGHNKYIYDYDGELQFFGPNEPSTNK